MQQVNLSWPWKISDLYCIPLVNRRNRLGLDRGSPLFAPMGIQYPGGVVA